MMQYQSLLLNRLEELFALVMTLMKKTWITSQYPANYPKGIDIELDKKDIMALLDYWIEVWKFPKPIICQVQGACLSGAV